MKRIHVPIIALAILSLAAAPATRPSTRPATIKIGEVFAQPILIESLPDAPSSRQSLLREKLAGPIVLRYADRNKARLTPTDAEIDAMVTFNQKHHETQRAGHTRHRDSIKDQLANPDLPPDQRKHLESRLKTAESVLDRPPPGRDFAQWWLGTWKLQRALYHDFGGGRVIHQQLGPEALDATRTLLEQAQKAGDLKILLPYRDDFWHYWNRNHLTLNDQDLKSHFLEPAWAVTPAPQPATRPAQ